MRRKLLLALPVCALLAVCVLAAGTAGDPLASLSYLTGLFTDRVEEEIDDRLDASDSRVLDREDGAAESASVWTETRLKSGDVLSGRTGTMALLLAGDARVDYPSGAVIDVSAGEVVPSGAALAADHRYLVAEDTSAAFTVTSKTAVLDYQGPYALSESDAIDYNAIASALKRLHLFAGGSVGFGQGFALESAPTRLQALIMFIRVLGEEEEALSWTGTTPFQDVAAGSLAEKYIGYAFECGYTNGYGDRFKPSAAVNAGQYTEFLLRAMGWSSTANTDLSDALERGADAGLLTEGEIELLRGAPFLRADLVYLSFRALETELPEGQTLAEDLMDKDVFTWREWRSAVEMVPEDRP